MFGIITLAKEKQLDNAGFTLIEVAMVVVVLGIVLTIGTVSYANMSKGMNLQAAKKQVSAAITRAKLSSRQENVDYRIIFYPDDDAGHPNMYEFLHAIKDEGNDSWSLQPVDKSVSGEQVTADGGHYYIKVGGPTAVTTGATIDFHPSGTMLFIPTIPGSEGSQTISLSVENYTGSVSIDAEGKITQE